MTHELEDKVLREVCEVLISDYYHRICSDQDVSISGNLWIDMALLGSASLGMGGDLSWDPVAIDEQYYFFIRDQERAMTYLSLIHGSNGHLYFAYVNSRPDPDWFLPEDNPDLWSYFSELNQEMDDLAREVLFEEKAINEFHLLEDTVHVRLIEIEDEYDFIRYIIALNPDTLASADIHLDGSYLGEYVNRWEFLLMDDGLVYQYNNGVMDLTLRPLERFVLKIHRGIKHFRRDPSLLP